MLANKKYIYVSRKTPIYMLFRSKAPKCSKFSVTNIREKPKNFFMAPHGRRSPNNLTNSGSIAKVFVPVKTIIPCENFY